MKIDNVEVRVVSPRGQRHTWSHDLPEQYITITLVRIRTDEGAEGIAGVGNYTSFQYDRYTSETLRHLIPLLHGMDPLLPEDLRIRLRPRVFPIPPAALAVVDIALWDLMGKIASLPLYQLLGGARHRIPSYASTPLLPDVPAYLQFVDDLIEQGFRAIKFHTWCLPERDLELARAVRKHHPGQDITFMLDVENNYDRKGALRVAQELEDLGFGWFEAPFPDFDLESYSELTRRVTIPILPSGNWIQDLPTFASALTRHCWSSARTDATMLGGITGTRKALALVEAAEMKCEIMSWGPTVISAANLHLMLSVPFCTYFEQAVPYDSYEFAMKDVIRTRSDGYVDAPKGPGLGVQLDWKAIESATICTFNSASAT
jgi:L-alanine-DL-glutamate epimerase-like enolase superfamily enzyme